MPQVGRNIRAERIRQGMKQEYLADRIGMTQSNLSKMESGAITTSVDYVEKAAVVLRVTVIMLYGIDANAPADPILLQLKALVEMLQREVQPHVPQENNTVAKIFATILTLLERKPK